MVGRRPPNFDTNLGCSDRPNPTKRFGRTCAHDGANLLTRLADKGLVEKTQPATGRGLLFTPTTTRERHTATQLLDLLERTGDPRLALSHFAKGLSTEAAAELKKLLD